MEVKPTTVWKHRGLQETNKQEMSQKNKWKPQNMADVIILGLIVI